MQRSKLCKVSLFKTQCSYEEPNSSTSWIAWGWVNSQQILIFGWTIPLTRTHFSQILFLYKKSVFDSHPILVIMCFSEPQNWFQNIFWAIPAYCRRKSAIFKHNSCYIWSAWNYWTKTMSKSQHMIQLNTSMHIWYVKIHTTFTERKNTIKQSRDHDMIKMRKCFRN